MEVYTKNLSPEGMHANWLPSPNERLPAKNRSLGIKLGDVGLITPHGGFDYAYNVSLPSNDPLNVYGAPAGHVPLKLDIWVTNEFYSRGQVLQNERHLTRSFMAGVSSMLGCSADLLFDVDHGNGASCSFPEGANLEHLLNTRHLKIYLKDNKLQLLDFLYKTLGRQGYPVVVTECVKTSMCVLEVDSSIASSTGASASADAAGAGAQFKFGTTTTVSGSRITRVVSKDEFGTPNKCPFMTVIRLHSPMILSLPKLTGGSFEVLSSSATHAALENSDGCDLAQTADDFSTSMLSHSVAGTPLHDCILIVFDDTYEIFIPSVDGAADPSSAPSEPRSSAVGVDNADSCLEPGNPTSFQQRTHTGSPSDPLFPPLGKPLSESSSPTPILASSEDDPVNAPPSPTLSTSSSEHFATSQALRHIEPEETLGLLPAGGQDENHGKKGSKATFANSAEGDSGLRGTKPCQERFANRHAVANFTSMTNEAPTLTHADREFVLSKSSNQMHDRDQSYESNAVANGMTGEENEEAGKEGSSMQGLVAMDCDFDEDIIPSSFAFEPLELTAMLEIKDLEMLIRMGGVRGLLKGLRTHRTRGLSENAQWHFVPSSPCEAQMENVREGYPSTGSGAGFEVPHVEKGGTNGGLPGIVVRVTKEAASTGSDAGDPAANEGGPLFLATLNDRRKIYGENVLPCRARKTLLQLMRGGSKDKILIRLTIGVLVSLALSLFQAFCPLYNRDPPLGSVDGVAIMVTIFIVVIIGLLNDWQKECQFWSFNDKKEDRVLHVVRDNVEQIIDAKDVVVGDVAMFEPGEIIPCDGVFLSGHNVKCDESATTGESDAIKVSYEECLALRLKTRDVCGDELVMKLDGAHADCFVVSGSRVLEGVGSYVVVAVGPKSFNSKIMMALRGDTENTPLPFKLNALADLIARLGSAASLVLSSYSPFTVASNSTQESRSDVPNGGMEDESHTRG